MKAKQLFILSAITLCIFSCSKNEDITPTPPDVILPVDTPNLFRVRQGVETASDTFTFVYHNPNRSFRGQKFSPDSLLPAAAPVDTAVYDPSGKLLSMAFNGGTSLITYSYYSDGKLKEISMFYKKFIFQYTNGQLSKRIDSIPQNGTMILWSTSEYTFQNGNISSRRDFNNSGNLEDETFFTYGSEPNPFAYISLQTYNSYIAISPAIKLDAYFNQNVLTGFTSNGRSGSITYTWNSFQQPTKAVCFIPSDGIYGGIEDHTFTFEYSYQ